MLCVNKVFSEKSDEIMNKFNKLHRHMTYVYVHDFYIYKCRLFIEGVFVGCTRCNVEDGVLFTVLLNNLT